METKNLSILIVDDDSSLRRVLERSFQNRGFEVTVAKNGLHALKCIRKQMPRLIFLDLVMPNVTGFQFLSMLRRHLKDEPPPNIIILTNLCGVTEIIEYAEFGQFGEELAEFVSEFSEEKTKWKYVERYIAARFGLRVSVFSKFDTKILHLVSVVQSELQSETEEVK